MKSKAATALSLVIPRFAVTKEETFIPVGASLPEDIESHGVEMTHLFAGEGYAKVFNMPAGTTIGQHAHRVNHFATLMLGRVVVKCDGVSKEYLAPATIMIRSYARHEIKAITESVWACLWRNPDRLTDPDEFDLVVTL